MPSSSRVVIEGVDAKWPGHGDTEADKPFFCLRRLRDQCFARLADQIENYHNAFSRSAGWQLRLHLDQHVTDRG